MSSVFEVGGLAGWAMLVGPLAILGMALAMTLLWPYRLTPAQSPKGTSAAAVPSAAAPSRPSPSPAARSAEPASLQLVPPAPGVGLSANAPVEPPATGTTQEATSAAPVVETEQAVPERLPESPEISAARAMIDEARNQIAAGDRTAAADNLRAAIMLAAKSGNRELHASARLELGDIAQAEGDLHTACEHWQLARSLFEEVKSLADAAKCEKRMDSNGCPTDWVLNDF